WLFPDHATPQQLVWTCGALGRPDVASDSASRTSSLGGVGDANVGGTVWSVCVAVGWTAIVCTTTGWVSALPKCTKPRPTRPAINVPMAAMIAAIPVNIPGMLVQNGPLALEEYICPPLIAHHRSRRGRG